MIFNTFGSAQCFHTNVTAAFIIPIRSTIISIRSTIIPIRSTINPKWSRWPSYLSFWIYQVNKTLCNCYQILIKIISVEFFFQTKFYSRISTKHRLSGNQTAINDKTTKQFSKPFQTTVQSIPLHCIQIYIKKLQFI